MCQRVLLVLFVLVNSASAVVVQDGDFYESLRVEGEFLMTGGVVEELELIAYDNTPTYYIQGGTIGVRGYSGIETRGGIVDISGGTLYSGLERELGGKTIIRGSYFQYVDKLRVEYNNYRVRGWLDDGSFLDYMILNSQGNPLSNPAVEFVITPSDGLRGDADGDWSVGISDLNAVRNNFGSLAERRDGDVDGDGEVSMSDLNIVRNAFNPVQFFDPNVEKPGTLFEVKTSQSTKGPRTSINLSQPVPEPSSLVTALGCVALAGIASRCRRNLCRFHRHPRQCP